jgi:flavin-dependent dehydrogenase
VTRILDARSMNATPAGACRNFEPCDVAIVGGGPAGATAALRFARAGLHVVLVDRHAFPRPKPCGDCLSPQASRLLDEMDLLQGVEATGPAHLAGWRIIGPAGRSFDGRFADVCGGDPLVETALAISRSRLDAVLLDAARLAGACVRAGVRVTDVVEAGPTERMARIHGIGPDGQALTLAAQLVVGADGLRSIVSRRMSPPRPPRLRKVSLTAHLTGVDAPQDLGEMHLAAGSCAGIAPVTAPRTADVVHNVTVVADAGRFGREVACDPIGFFWRSLRQFAGLAGRFDRAAPAAGEAAGRGRTGWLLACGPFDRPVRRIVGRGVALVGDAAGYFDPFTGQGICHALDGARLLAGSTIGTLLRGAPLESSLAEYAARHRRLVRGPRLLQQVIEAIIGRPALADRAIDWLARTPAAGNALLAATGDLAPAATLVSPGMVLRLASTPWRALVRA